MKRQRVAIQDHNDNHNYNHNDNYNEKRKNCKTIENESKTELRLSIGDSTSHWPFRLLHESGALYTCQEPNTIKIDPVLHLRTHRENALNWLVPWFSSRVEAVCAYRLAARAQYTLDKNDWLPNYVLRSSFLSPGPFGQKNLPFPALPVRNFRQLTDQAVSFISNIEAAWREGQLGAVLSKHLNTFLCVELSQGLCAVRPLTKSDHKTPEGSLDSYIFRGHLPLEHNPSAIFKTVDDLDHFLQPGIGLFVNAITGDLSPEPNLINVSARGCVLADSLNFDYIPTVVAHLRATMHTSAPSLVVVGKLSLPSWIEALPDAKVVHDEASWHATRIHKKSDSPSLVLATFEFLQSEAFRVFHALSHNRASIDTLRTVFRALTLKNQALLDVLTHEQSLEVSSNLFRVDLQSFMRVLQLGSGVRGNDVVELATRLLSSAEIEPNSLPELPDIDDNFDSLFYSRLNLQEKWERVVLDNPRRFVFHEFKRDTKARFSPETCGLHCQNLAFGTSHRSKAFLHFALVCASGFKIILESKPFTTMLEVRWCIDLLDFRLNNAQWTQIAEDFVQGSGHGLLNANTRSFRVRLFTWATLMAMATVCGLKRVLPPAQVARFTKQEIAITEGERAFLMATELHSQDPSSPYTCLPFISRSVGVGRKRATLQRDHVHSLTTPAMCSSPDCDRSTCQVCSLVLCHVCSVVTGWKAKCGHSLCLPCLDEWQAKCLQKKRAVSCPTCRAEILEMNMVCESDVSRQMNFKNRVRDESGSKVAQLLLFFNQLELQDDRRASILVLSSSQMLLEECCRQGKNYFPSLSMSRFEGGSFVWPRARVLYTSFADLLLNGADFAACDGDLTAIFLEPCESMSIFKEVLNLVSGCKRTHPIEEVKVFFVADSTEAQQMSVLSHWFEFSVEDNGQDRDQQVDEATAKVEASPER
jgi:hypothetical protein